MNQREKGLLAVIVGLLGFWFLWQGYSSYEDGYDKRVTELADLDDELFEQDLEARRSREALRRLERYQEQSLPSDPEVARSVYSAWLVETIQGSGLELDNVKWNATRRQGEAATALTFSAAAQGSPEAVTRLLDAYYRLDVLHQLVSCQLRAIDDDGELWSVTLTSVALVIDGAEREAGLPGPVDPGETRLRLATADEYVESVAGRNLFASYTPPPPPRPKQPKVVSQPKPPKPKPPEFDDAEHAQLTGIVETGARLEAWVFVRTTGERLRLHTGDALEVGQLKGRVQAVLPGEIVVESEDGTTWRAALGAKLRDAESKAAERT